MGTTPTSPRRAASPARYPTPRRRAPSPLPRILGLSALAVVVLLLVGWSLYALPAWRLGREVRLAAYSRYVNIADQDRIRELVDRHHAEVLGQSFKGGARRTAAGFQPAVYNRLMDGFVLGALAKGAPAETGTAPSALVVQPGKAPPRADSAGVTPPGVAPDAIAPPGASGETAPARGPAHALKITAMSAERVPRDPSEMVVLLRLTLDLEDSADDVFVPGTEPLLTKLSCPSGGEYSTSSLRADGTPREVGRSKRYGFLLTIPPTAVGTSAEICTLVATVRDAAGQEASAKSFVALR